MDLSIEYGPAKCHFQGLSYQDKNVKLCSHQHTFNFVLRTFLKILVVEGI